MREAIAAGDTAVMRDLTSSENLPKLEPGSIFVLSAELWGNGAEDRRAEVFRILEQGRSFYPGDFVLQAVAGSFYQAVNGFESALACRTAALSLRPGDYATRFSVAESLYFLGRLPESLATLRACIAADPSNVEAVDLLGVVQLLLGDSAGALATLSRCPGIQADPGSLADLRVARFSQGVLSREEFERFLDNEFDATVLSTNLIALLEHPDPKQRDPQFVLRALAERAQALGTPRWRTALEILAHVRLEEWGEALALLEGPFQVPSRMLVTPMTYDFVAAVIYARLGREGEARQCLKRGMSAWDEQTRFDPEAWNRSDAARWRREAEAALAR
jgi:tetratricopeptide (TPR) repeat protein